MTGPSVPDPPDQAGSSVEDRWRRWSGQDGEPRAAPEAGAAPEPEPDDSPPVGRRSLLLVAGLVGLAVAGTVAGFRIAGRDRPDPSASVSTSGDPGGSGSTPGRRELDLTSRAVAEAPAAPSTQSPRGDLVQFPADNVLDRDTASAWRTAGPGDGAVLTLVFPQEVEVTRVGLAVGEPDLDAPASAAPLRGRVVEQVTWSAGGRSEVQQLTTGTGDVQLVTLAEPLRGRSVTLTLDRTVPGPVAADDFTAVTQVVVYGAPTSG